MKHSAVLNVISCDAALTRTSSSYSRNIIIHAAFRANFKRFVPPAELTGISWSEVGLSPPPEIHEKAAINEIYIVLLRNCVIELSTNYSSLHVYFLFLCTETKDELLDLHVQTVARSLSKRMRKK